MPEERAQHSEEPKGHTALEDLRGSVAPFDRVEEAATGIATLRTKHQEGFGSRVRDRSQLCLACGQVSVYRFLYKKNGCDIQRCERCGLGRAETMGFDPESYYTSDYFSGERPDGYADYIGTENILRREFVRTVQSSESSALPGDCLKLDAPTVFFCRKQSASSMW